MSAPTALETHWFVAPPLDGPVTGGTLYNREIIAALGRAGGRAAAIDPESARRALSAHEPGWYWVDTLYLDEFPALLERARPPSALGLLAHYLPSLVREPKRSSPELSAEERFVIREAEALIAPSRFLGDLLAAHAAAPIGIVEPGRLASGLAPQAASREESGLRATLVANLLPGKGVEPFLAALGKAMRERDAFTLAIIGDDSLDREYAARCRAALAREPLLAGRVRFEGALSPKTVTERLSQSDLVISSSRMESYGMVLAEARTLGVPILALGAGNTSMLAEARAGSELVDDDDALAAACLHLARDRSLLTARRRAARAFALPPRSWDAAARELNDFARRCSLESPTRDTPREKHTRTMR